MTAKRVGLSAFAVLAFALFSAFVVPMVGAATIGFFEVFRAAILHDGYLRVADALMVIAGAPLMVFGGFWFGPGIALLVMPAGVVLTLWDSYRLRRRRPLSRIVAPLVVAVPYAVQVGFNESARTSVSGVDWGACVIWYTTAAITTVLYPISVRRRFARRALAGSWRIPA